MENLFTKSIFCGIMYLSYLIKGFKENKMKDKQIYTPAKVEIIKLGTTDVITASPTFDPDIPEAEWDKEM